MNRPQGPDDLRAESPVEPRLAPLVERFEAAWQSASEGTPPPELDALVDEAPPEHRTRVRELLQAIERQYRALPDDRRHAQPTDTAADQNTAIYDDAPAPEPGSDPRPEPSESAIDLRLSSGVVLDKTFVPGETPIETIIGSDEAGSELPDFELGQPADPAAAATADWSNEEAGSRGGAASDPAGRDARARGGTAQAPVVAGYEVIKELGRGGMGVVYLARQKGLNRLVALKMILAGGHAGAQQLARFQAEAEAVAQLQHNNIVQIHEIGWQAGLPYFSLEYVDGRSLEEERAGRPIAPARAAETVETLASAMQYAHEQGIVHRDLKPANVLLTHDGVPKISDFGLVKRVEGDSSQTKTGTIMGTPSYMAPEQAWGDKNVGPLADVYALGAMLYTLLTGRPPFLGATPLETVMQLRYQEPVPPSRLQPKTPRDLETICLKCLQKDPQKRYGTAHELAEDLRRFRTGEPILARPVGRLERTWRWCRRNPSLALSGGAALVLALCLMIGGPMAAMLIYEQKVAADEARGLEEQARELAERNEQKAVASQKKADENAKIAGQQRDLAVGALNTLVEEVQNQLKDRPQMQALKQTLLLTAMRELDKVYDSAGAAHSTDRILASALKKMGDLLMEIGETQKALEQYQRCHAIVVAMDQEGNPEKPHVPKLNLGRSYARLGTAAERLKDARAAREHYLDSLAARQKALELAPDDPQARRMCQQELAESYGLLGSVSLALGEPKQAREHYLESMTLRAESLKHAPHETAARRELAGACAGLGGACLESGDIQAALEHYQESLRLLQSVAAAETGTVSSSGNLAMAHADLGTANLFAEQNERAREQYTQAVDLWEKVAGDDPRNAHVRRHLAFARYGLGAACLRLGDAAAHEHFLRCLRLREELAAKDPGDLRYQADLMLALARCGEDAKAVRIAEGILARAPEDPGLLYLAGCGYALCATASAGSQAAGDEPGTDRRDLPEHYGTQAVRILTRAIEHGYRGRALLRMDPDLEPIRERADFQGLLEKLDAS